MLLRVNNLSIEVKTNLGWKKIVSDVGFDVDYSEIVFIVGESGSGKSVLCNTIPRLLPESIYRISKGEILFENKDLSILSDNEMNDFRGNKIGMVFQESMSSLNPTMKIGEQIIEGYRYQNKISSRDSRIKTIELLKMVGIENPELRIDQFPHELSGGQKQRINIAVAISCNPKLLILDESTTSIDLILQNKILNLVYELKNTLNISIVFITHDLLLASEYADKVCVMYGGRIVELRKKNNIFKSPKHPYTKSLIKSFISKYNKSPKPIEGFPPNLIKDGTLGCPFKSRCSFYSDVCEEFPRKKILDDGWYCCWLKDEDS